MPKKKEIEPRDTCPICKSTRHSPPFELVTGGYSDDVGGEMEFIPTTTEIVFCGDCGVMRAYDYSLYVPCRREYY